MGKHQLRLLRFMLRFPGWQTISKHDANAIRAIGHLEGLGLVQVVRYGKGVSPSARIAVGGRYGKQAKKTEGKA